MNVNFCYRFILALYQNKVNALDKMDLPTVTIVKEGDVVVRETPLKDGRPHGTEKQWSATGTLICERAWVDGKQHGEEIYYKADGSIAFKNTFVNGAPRF